MLSYLVVLTLCFKDAGWRIGILSQCYNPKLKVCPKACVATKVNCRESATSHA